MRGLPFWILSLCLTGSARRDNTARARRAPLPDIRQSGFVYCVSGILNTFNPQMASSGLTVDTLAAQLYDRLLDVDPTYRLIPELAQSWEVLDNGATYRFHLRKDVPFQTTAWFTPTRKMNADDVVFSFARVFDQKHPYHDVNGGEYPYFDSLQFGDSVQSVKARRLYGGDSPAVAGRLFPVAPGDPLCAGAVRRVRRSADA